MTIDPASLATMILDNAESVSALSPLDGEELRLKLWHIVAGIAINHYMGEANGTPPPNIDSLTDSVMPIVVDALKK